MRGGDCVLTAVVIGILTMYVHALPWCALFRISNIGFNGLRFYTSSLLFWLCKQCTVLKWGSGEIRLLLAICIIHNNAKLTQ